jgi:HD-like signal output (HDOD) protein/GGDEF domain-containing protein
MTEPATTLDRLAARAERLYSLPAVAMRVLDLTHNPQVDTRALKECIENDPALAAKILRVVNSSLFGLSREVSDLQQALGLLGIKPLKLLVLSFSLPAGLFLDLEAHTLAWYWRRTLSKAIAAREMAEHLWRMPGDEAFLAGLLQDLGVLLLLQELGRPYARLVEASLARHLDLAALETEALGFSHTALSARLLGRWKLPEPLIEAVAYRALDGDPRSQQTSKSGVPLLEASSAGRESDPSAGTAWNRQCHTAARPPALAQILHLAELIARLLVDGQPEALAELLAAGRNYYRRLEPLLEPLVSALGEKVAQLADVLSLQLPGGLEYRDVLAEAHRRLAGVAGRAAEELLGSRCEERAEPEEEEAPAEVQDLAAAVAAVCGSADSIPSGDQGDTPRNPRAAAGDPPRPAEDAAAPPPAIDRSQLLGPLVRAVAASRKSRRPLSLLLVEIDQAEGRARTSDSLQPSAWLGVLEAACRRVDHPPALSMAYGNAGFAILLPDCDRQRAVELGNQLAREFRRVVAAGEEGSARLRLDVGVASVTLPPKNFPTAELLAAAGRCLFGSHASGGNVVKSIEIY